MISFKPGANNTTLHAYTAATGATQFANANTLHNIVIDNAGTGDAYVAFGQDNTITTTIPVSFATQGGFRIPAGGHHTLSVFGSWVAVIGASTGNVFITRGDGN